MRHRSAGRKLGRTTSHRIAFAVTALREERIITGRLSEQVTTPAKRGTRLASRAAQAARDIHDQSW
jgi:ribosomal protein L17